jgi:hypothetical protein
MLSDHIDHFKHTNILIITVDIDVIRLLTVEVWLIVELVENIFVFFESLRDAFPEK